MRQPKLSHSSESYETIKQVYDDINAVETEMTKRDVVEHVVKQDPTSTAPFRLNDNLLPKRRIVIYGTTVYEFIKTSLGWKYHEIV